jgi:tRNA (guanine37-N1)-methyltransferase
MKFTVITLFPQLIEAFLEQGLLGQARAKGLIEVSTLNPRQYTEDAHHTVDDKVFGGGDGMVMRVEPLAKAVQALRAAGELRVVALSPQGRVWSQSEAAAWAEHNEHVALVCGRYAGIDHRFTVLHADEEISIGDFVLNGGEIAACAIIESVSRLVPGVLGNQVSAVKDTFAGGLLECPQFTRPREVDGLTVPEPLLSGHHKKIAEFELAVSKVRTALFRPDLFLDSMDLSQEIRLLQSLSNSELHALGLTRETLEDLVRE